MTQTLTPTAPATAPCPECEESIEAPLGLIAHEILTCEACGAELEAVSAAPFVVELAPEIEEDWGE